MVVFRSQVAHSSMFVTQVLFNFGGHSIQSILKLQLKQPLNCLFFTVILYIVVEQTINTYMNECVHVHVLLHAECGVEYCSVCSDVPAKCSECSTGYILTDGVCGEFRFSGRGM